MGRANGALGLGACALAFLLAGCADDVSQNYVDWRHDRRESENQGFSDWANISSNLMVEEYGAPDRIETFRLVWVDRGPWKKIAVWDGVGFFQDGGSENLEETVSYLVPEDKRRALRSFSRGLYVSRDGTEISARSESEGRNYLMLNLADRIVKGEFTPEQARASYEQTIQLSESGKSSPSMERLLFRD